MSNRVPVIELQHVSKSYPLGPGLLYEALKEIQLKIYPGEFIAIMGPSGSGKSTLMHILGALDVPTSGTYLFHGKDISTYDSDQLAEIRNKEIGFVFQSFNLLRRTSVLENVQRPMYYAGIPKQERRERALASLEAVGIADKANNISNQISGGQIQRVAIARAVVMNPSLLLADEPTGNLDTKTSKEIMELFVSLHKSGRTIIIITHEPDIAAYAQRQIRIIDGTIVSDTKK